MHIVYTHLDPSRTDIRSMNVDDIRCSVILHIGAIRVQRPKRRFGLTSGCRPRISGWR